MSFEIAVSLPVMYSTVIYAIEDIAHSRQGEPILIYAAAGGVGQGASSLVCESC